MSLLLVQMSAADVLRAFHRDAVYLFLGAAFVAVGIVSAGFSAVRRKYDPLLTYFAIFAVLYGVRLWIQSGIVRMDVHESSAYLRFRLCINYLVPIPAILFFRVAGLLGRVGKIAAHLLIAVSFVFAVVTIVFGPATIYDQIDSGVVILAMIALVAQTGGSIRDSADFSIVRRGLLVFAAFVIWDNVRGILRIDFLSLEPFGFAVFLASLGYVAARRTLYRDQQLSEIQKELEVARRIQLSILPQEFPDSPHFRVSARYLPMTSVAGDFYDFIVSSPSEAGLLIADVSGHGVPAALIASMVKLAAAAEKDHASDPSVFLSRMNAALCGNTQNQFVTAAYVHLDSSRREFRYSAAGHPPMLLLRGNEIHSFEENGLILGLFETATYSTRSHALERGDRLLLYTDGIVEASNGAGDFFGLEALSETFRQTEKMIAFDAVNFILSRVQKWAKTQDDDLTLLVCDYVG